MSDFQWSEKSEIVAVELAEGKTIKDASDIAGISERTIYRWLQVAVFSEEVDRLTFMVGVAHKAERLRLAKRVISSLGIATEKDLLDWLKYVQSETDGVKLDLTQLLTAITETKDIVAGSGPD